MPYAASGSATGGPHPPDHEVAVIGAGFSGIGAAIKLREAGVEDFVVIDDADGVGGTWHWNTFPGVAVDIPSFSYQFSFEQRAGWSRIYAPGHELKAYAEHCVRKYRIGEKIRLRTRIAGAEFDERLDLWRVTTTAGETLTARFLINATGVLTEPKLPEIAGVDRFAGEIVHTARWDHSRTLAGKRVGIIGTGASAVQVIPEIAPEVERLTVFQRTPIWCLPKPDGPLPGIARVALKRLPGGQRAARLASQLFVEATFPLAAHFHTVLPIAGGAERIARRFLRGQVEDPVTRERLTPRYAVGCKRPGFHNSYLSTFNRANVELVTDPIAAITNTGVRTADSRSRPLEVLILATGFKVFDRGNMPTFPLRGRGGVALEDWWDANRYQAYEGVSVPGFPNFFTILGPYGYNGSSYFNLIETQVRHVIRCLERARRERATVVEVRSEANARYFASMLARRGRQVFWQESCAQANSYYFNQHGDVPLRASLSLEAAWHSAHFDLDDYRFERRRHEGVRAQVAGARRILPEP
jgi:cation diffusion facilitator CzcD-associated flavoprotein CzcO